MASGGARTARPRQPDGAREFAAYVGGAAPRLLRTAALLTGEAGRAGAGTERPDGAGPVRGAAGTEPAMPPPGTEPPGTGSTALEPAAPRALALLRRALARTYADWDRLESGDPYDHTRAELLALFLRSSWYRRRPGRGPLAALPARVRLVLVLRLHEGVPEEQVAALLGLSVDRVRLLCARGVHLVLHPPDPGAAP
ncbi:MULTISPECIES: sigma factor-like helix-turn-helix DNA-binding protein [unclassified Streptomyces]|uniref:sigma factor-like helix-turn-helix DNA-binding protein n=1 Tax=unclassified Streptomyces TaxID=2593676 RepID=UPI00081DED1A|nr:sigma factor-like helix-turn-helix DNA-binding protein [Streptomyces sp. LcepLS]MYR26639.1 siderophore-interacting protein [Streptomyces sp. SID4945]SCF08002.1 Sigma-70, region 4 [Streptomyces sp. LcepLS]